MDQINRFREELPTLNLYKVPRHTRFWYYRVFVNHLDYCKFLSFQKYMCRSHHAEFGSSKYWYTNFMALALILNGYCYRVNYNSRNPELSINVKFTQSFYDTHRCQCTRKQIVERRWVQCNWNSFTHYGRKKQNTKINNVVFSLKIIYFDWEKHL